MSINRRTNQVGDTIIEVLLAMTIVGIVLAGAYTTASRSLRTSQFSQERTKATRIAESQIEQLKALNTKPTEVTNPGQFCIDITNSSNPIINANDPTDSNACVEDVFFKKIVTVQGDTYTVLVEWTAPGGSDDNKANVTLAYRSP